MKRLLLIISLLFLNAALFTQSICAYTTDAVQTLVAEEEPHDDKPSGNKKELKEKHHSYLNSLASSSSLVGSRDFYTQHKFCAKGFSEKPYTPPDFS